MGIAGSVILPLPNHADGLVALTDPKITAYYLYYWTKVKLMECHQDV